MAVSFEDGSYLVRTQSFPSADLIVIFAADFGACLMEYPQERAPRYSFSGSAEVVRAHSVAITEITQLSQYGCYLAAISSLPRGTVVTLRIKSAGKWFEAKASVLYSHPTLGMGLAFRDVKPLYRAVLQEWLQQAAERGNSGTQSLI